MATEKGEKQEVALTSQELLQLLGGALESPHTPSTLEGACSSVCAESCTSGCSRSCLDSCPSGSMAGDRASN